MLIEDFSPKHSTSQIKNIFFLILTGDDGWPVTFPVSVNTEMTL